MAGKHTMDGIRAMVGEMRAHEETLLGRRAEESQRSSRMSAAIIAIGTLASFAILIAAFMFLRREIGQRSMSIKRFESRR